MEAPATPIDAVQSIVTGKFLKEKINIITVIAFVVVGVVIYNSIRDSYKTSLEIKFLKKRLAE